MDYNQEQFFRMQQYDAPKLPFYMSYPMQNMYLTEMEYEKDMDRMKELYPREVKKILEYVHDECDRMEYEGSLMFDEYPDRMMLERIVNRILQAIAGTGKETENESNIQYPMRISQTNTDENLKSLIWVILNNEMYRRRCRHRRCRRWW